MTQETHQICGLMILALLPASAMGQTVIGTHETVEFNSPEGWAMAYMTAATLNLGQMPPRETDFGDLSIAAELGSIPRLNDDQQRVGFGGFKDEDLNKSPVFGRARMSFGLAWDFTAELAWTPPLELNGAKPDGLWGLAVSRPLLGDDNWSLGVRIFAQQGQVQADVTCSADVAAQTPGSAGNPLSCLEPSEDRLEMDHYGAEVSISMLESPLGLQPWASLAITRMDPFTEVNALVLGAIDKSTIDSKGTTKTFSIGVNYRIIDNWRINLATSYTPLDVERPPGNPGGQDNFWSVRLGLSWEL